MAGSVTVAVDAMGGDHGFEVTVPGVLAALERRRDLNVILVGDEPLLAKALKRGGGAPGERIALRHASEVVAMNEPPSKALRSKKDSSMRVAIDLVREGRAQAAVSAGNTGALMALSRFVLKTLPGIDRPAIISAIPSANGHTHLLDLGANAQCNAQQLFQFAVMGSVVASVVHGLPKPRVALLNIGEEEIKGTEMIKEAAQLLSASSLNYVGFVEGDDIFLGTADVVVADGFVGNVALKTGEGVAKLVREYLREEFTRHWWSKAMGVVALPALVALRRRIDPRNYNGASFVGLNGTVIKSHGGADAVAFANAIGIAVLEVEKAVPQRISSLLSAALAEAQTAMMPAAREGLH